MQAAERTKEHYIALKSARFREGYSEGVLSSLAPVSGVPSALGAGGSDTAARGDRVTPEITVQHVRRRPRLMLTCSTVCTVHAGRESAPESADGVVAVEGTAMVMLPTADDRAWTHV